MSSQRPHKKVVIIITVTIVALMGFGAMFLAQYLQRDKDDSYESVNSRKPVSQRNEKEYPETSSVPDSFEEISGTVVEIVDGYCDEFSKTAPEERKECAEKILKDLVARGALQEEFICFDDANQQYQFITNDGVINYISLSDLNPDIMGIGGTSEDSDNSDDTDKGNRADTETVYFPDGYPYSEEALAAEELEMVFLTNLFVNSIDFDAFQYLLGKIGTEGDLFHGLDEYVEYHEFYYNNTFKLLAQGQVQYKDIPLATVNQLRTCLKGYDFISLNFHGAYTDNPILGELSHGDPELLKGALKLVEFLVENFNTNSTTNLLIPEAVSIVKDGEYHLDMIEGRVCRHLANFGYTYFVTPLFFNYYYKDNALKNSIVYIGACSGYRNSTLVGTFDLCGAEAVLGYDKSVNNDYAAKNEWRLLHWLMCGGTVGEALDFAQALQGKSDPKSPYATLKIYPGGENVVLIKDAVCSHNYELINKNLSYEDAVKYCEYLGGKLACIDTPAAQRAVDEKLKDAERNCYLIAAQREEDGKIKWNEKKKEVGEYFNWAANEPSSDEKLVMLYGHSDPEKGTKVGEWNDVNYDPNLHEGFYAAEQFGFICEFEPGQAYTIVDIEDIPDEKKDEPVAYVNAEGYVVFGHYEQDANEENGKEPIEWVILDENEDSKLLVSRYVLDKIPYNREYADVTWETSSLRSWLNYEFINTAFSAEEQARISKTHLENWGVEADGGNSTDDQVFCLSLDELSKYYSLVYDKHSYFGYGKNIITLPTAYAKECGVWNYTITEDDVYDDYLFEFAPKGYAKSCVGVTGAAWWLRTMGWEKDACLVCPYGYAGANYEFGVSSENYGVRPALWVSKDAIKSEPIPVSDNDVPIDEEHFPDAAFRKYISDNLDPDKNSILTQKEIEDVKEIDVHDCGIHSLVGISFFKNLSRLWCGYNDITGLNVSSLPCITSLYCNNNNLRSLNLGGLINLKHLNCEGNQLSTIDVSQLTNLEDLSCGNNNLTSIDVSQLTNLEHLSCENNNLTSIDVSQLTNLRGLSCQENLLTELDVSNLTKLLMLICGDNQLTSLDVSNLRLGELQCQNNQLSSLDVRNSIYLYNLYCYDNQLSSLEVSGLDCLEELRCSSNQLKTLDLSGLTNLRDLCCDGNQLTSIDVSGLRIGDDNIVHDSSCRIIR